MAIAYARTKSLNRADGYNAVKSSAYACRERMTDEQTGAIFDFRPKGKNSPAILLPVIVPEGEKAIERQDLWNMAERSEKRINSTVAREMIAALPNELDADAQRRIIQQIGEFIAEQHGVAVDGAIHRDAGNNHAHVKWTSRRFSGGELTEKTRELDLKATASKSLLAIRQHWENACNNELAAAGLSVRIDMRSYEEQGIEKEGQIHLGQKAFYHQQRTGCNEKHAKNERIKERNFQRSAARRAARSARKNEAIAGRFQQEAERLRSESKVIHHETGFENPAPTVFLSASEGEILRGKALVGEFSKFLTDRTSEAEFIAALRRFQSKEQAANLDVADDGGNKFTHLSAAVNHKLNKQRKNSAGSETRRILEEIARVGEAWRSTGHRIDFKAHNAHGQTPAIVLADGLATTPGATLTATLKTSTGRPVRVVYRQAKAKRPTARPRRPQRGPGRAGSATAMPISQQMVSMPVAGAGMASPLAALDIGQRLEGRKANTAQQGKLLPGQWIIPDNATPAERAAILAHNRDVANATATKYSRRLKNN